MYAPSARKAAFSARKRVSIGSGHASQVRLHELLTAGRERARKTPRADAVGKAAKIGGCGGKSAVDEDQGGRDVAAPSERLQLVARERRPGAVREHEIAVGDRRDAREPPRFIMGGRKPERLEPGEALAPDTCHPFGIASTTAAPEAFSFAHVRIQDRGHLSSLRCRPLPARSSRSPCPRAPAPDPSHPNEQSGHPSARGRHRARCS